MPGHYLDTGDEAADRVSRAEREAEAAHDRQDRDREPSPAAGAALMATLVERLRQAAQDRTLPEGISLMEIPKVWPGHLEAEAAAEIERLERDLKHEQGMHRVLAEKFETAIEEQKRLATALAAAESQRDEAVAALRKARPYVAEFNNPAIIGPPLATIDAALARAGESGG